MAYGAAEYVHTRAAPQMACNGSGQLLVSAPSRARVARRGRAATVRRRRPKRCGLWHGSNGRTAESVSERAVRNHALSSEVSLHICNV